MQARSSVSRASNLTLACLKVSARADRIINYLLHVYLTTIDAEPPTHEKRNVMSNKKKEPNSKESMIGCGMILLILF
ncbi:Uncharacterised protein [Corynebacterium jeikeium]|nr:Uncharacterised protein [Corynebacterium jeikeium]